MNGKRLRQRWIDTIKLNQRECTPESRIEECKDREMWQEIVKTVNALNGL